mmetsp:Transcript_19077/g.26667  ORF Transcript_19077/g.26667 Transcript_19077/m.26667 type:complete len:239 (-) Transcript_19077:351-1067(-)|eukprot:CAMPEP_0184479904 /NCGR_PEP_ID=MMETSP0113_2-20130426/1440_1 /TAXON_ID=91329 /ORGANISM="Norrisiella sphaerica, Strain BC52" /LENGTH=238 /DNA_ID=CAMNT_0026858071 /DNA_START=102 /DNA_END=818 /DNA_ORIENTATION=+
MLAGLQSGLGGKSLLLLVSTVGAWWFISREINRPRKRKPRVPLFRRRSAQDCEDESESECIWEEKSLESDDESDDEFFANQSRRSSGEGSPPEDTPLKKEKNKKNHQEKGTVSVQEVVEKESAETSKILEQEEPEEDESAETKDGPVSAGKLILRTHSHSKLKESQDTHDKVDNRSDGEMFYGLLKLYSKDISIEERPQTPKRRESFLLCRESFEHTASDEGDPCHGEHSSEKIPSRV